MYYCKGFTHNNGSISKVGVVQLKLPCFKREQLSLVDNGQSMQNWDFS